MEKITAHPKFFVLATMNPGGDYGKKELSPALRNRFTEIWVPSVGELNELRSIALQRYVKYEVTAYMNNEVNQNFLGWLIMRDLSVQDFQP